jgi:glycerol-1-phosphate dehydrogenase [NAD(P)+]
LSNLSALQDWIFASKNYNIAINDLAFTLSKNSALSIIQSKIFNSKDKTFIRGIISGQINSGIAMILSGNTRPCSGSEHLISHALDYLDLNEELHGTQVGKLSLFTLYLHNKLDSNILDYAKRIKIDGRFNALLNQETAINVFDLSRKMRINRRTILDSFKNEELYYKYIEFLDFCLKNEKNVTF